jgi:hypothetical protein
MQNCIEFLKKHNELRNTTQMNGWKILKRDKSE